MNETVEHVIHEEPDAAASASPEAISDAAAVAVATAGAAAALASETAAHAELQAASETAAVAEEVDEWKAAIAAQAQELGIGLASLSDRLSAIDSREEERHNAAVLLMERLLALEEAEAARQMTASPSSTPPESPGTMGEAPTVEEQTATAPIVGAETTATLGPVEAGAGGSISSSGAAARAAGETNPAPRARKRWI
jgi:hypothetical protein